MGASRAFPGRIIYVAGKNPKPDPLLHRALLWRALQSGLAAVQPDCAAALDEDSFSIAAWNRHYYGTDRDSAPDFDALERLYAGNWDDARDRGDAENWRVGFERTVRRIADRHPLLLRWIANKAVREVIAETGRYFDRHDAIGRTVRETVKAPIRRWFDERRPVLVIAHSMGSVITWDALWELTNEDNVVGKLDLITIGSPLGMRFTQQRLCGSDRKGRSRFTALIRQWHNIAAVGDLIALDPTMADDFGDMRGLGMVDTIEDHYQGIYTHYRDAAGLNPHRSYGYLIHPVMSARVAAWWWRHK